MKPSERDGELVAAGAAGDDYRLLPPGLAEVKWGKVKWNRTAPRDNGHPPCASHPGAGSPSGRRHGSGWRAG